MPKRVLGYLSAGPRVSTHPNAEMSGPRAHVLGVIHAFEHLGWDVKRFIVGDRIKQNLANKQTEKMLSANPVQTFAADMARIVLGKVNARKAWKEIGRVDWVYERHAVLQSLGWIFKKSGIPWILETNGILHEEAKNDRKAIVLDGLAKEMEIKAYQECDVLICVSQSLKDQIVQRLGIDSEKILVVPNGVDTEIYCPEQYQATRLSDSLTVGFVGNVIDWQGLDYLLKAVADLRDEGTSIHVTIVGDGFAKQELEQLAKSLGLQKQVTFVGRVPADQVPSYIAGFDIGFSGQVDLKSTKMYHSPLKLYEYMSMAKPVIASNHDDARRLIDGKNTGFLFNPGDLDDLKRALKQAVQFRDALPSMGKEAREEIVRNHSWDARVRRMIGQIEEMLGRKS